ncbi:MAG: zinc-ribbon domain-containing protein [Rhodobacteraceae bacterium]|nr:zinc-ribbon domain-containing protein [Paracoccaceae bacterium]
MRLICPNCDAQYELPDDVIPDEGRDVQCSGCGHTWFEASGDPVEMIAPPPPNEDAPQDAAQAPATARRELPADVTKILREEAAHEAAARAANDSNSVESQSGTASAAPHSAADHPAEQPSDSNTQTSDAAQDTDHSAEAQRTEESRRRMARMRGETAPAIGAAAAAVTRGEMLPDIDEINSSLRDEADAVTAQLAEEDTFANEQELAALKRRRGFRWGISLVLFILAALVLAYIYHDKISKILPQAEAPLASYHETVDQGRLWLDLKMQSTAAWLDGISDPQAAPASAPTVEPTPETESAAEE